MTTATHSLDATSGATTVAELLARNGARAGQAPHRRSRVSEECFEGTLPAFPPVDDTPTTQYRYDKTTVAALLETAPAEEPRAGVEKVRPARAGLKIAGLAFAGAVLAGGWALANAQAPGTEDGGTASGPVPSNNTPESDSQLLASAPVGAQVVTLASSSPTGTAEIPASAPAQQPDRGKFSGTLPNTTTQSKTTPPKTTAAAPPAPQISAPKLPPGTYVWPVNPYQWPGSHDNGGKYNGGGHHRHR
ncbi:hypothetical protein [Amycolatopsis sp. GM8]|uniref:hypothetical protein n=1 Tax=Amycolatopsis sp. GM8 TaxID=2896530 RepID=UPI001F449C72|nr:hypothetical protein [Amycolatopsis sp. GM8]